MLFLNHHRKNRKYQDYNVFQASRHIPPTYSSFPVKLPDSVHTVYGGNLMLGCQSTNQILTACYFNQDIPRSTASWQWS